MAHGFPCMACGHQQGTHEALSADLSDEELNTLIEGYQISLRDCRAYVPGEEEKAVKAEGEARRQPVSIFSFRKIP